MAEYIKRTDVMKICVRYSKHCFNSNDSKGQDIVDRILDDVVEIPTADVEEVKHGTWKKSQFSGRSGFYSLKDVICSECGIYSTFLQHEIRPDYYCPNCSAKMDGGKAE